MSLQLPRTRNWRLTLLYSVRLSMSVSCKYHDPVSRCEYIVDSPIRYFRQLQEISDTVQEVEWDNSVEDALQKNQTTRTELDKKINTARARHRYLNHLASKEGETGDDEEGDVCILCRCEFLRGYITQW